MPAQAAGGFHHFEIEDGALFEALRFEQAAGVVQLIQPPFQFGLDRRTSPG